jgi:serine/threonine protein kinase/tetratricopeptide (TPR) repeat protein
MTAPHSSAADDPLERLVFEVLEQGPGVLDGLCARHPELAPALRARVESLRRAGLLDEAAADRQLPETIGEFRVLELLGEGGMGFVFLAEQPALGRRVAVKWIRTELLYSSGARERFQREVAAVARLNHPGVIAIHSVGESEGRPYFAMEAVVGASLGELLRELADRRPERLSGAALYAALREVLGRRGVAVAEAPAPEAEIFQGTWPQVATRIALRIAEALAHAHERGVLHRDVKPGNVMLTEQGRVLLLDFGLAALEGSQRLTRTGTALGSLPYMSPEQLWSSTAVDAQSDVWSAGVTYYELLTLRLPFAGDSDLDLRSAIDAAHPSSPRVLHSGLSWDPETVCLAALERDRARRYPSAAALAADLRAVLELRPIAARRPGPWRQFLRLVRRHPARASAAIAAVVLLIGGPLLYGAVQRAARLRIDQANERTLRANQELELALEDLRVQRDRAEQNFESALEAVDTMLTKVGAERLTNVPRMDEVRRELLESALAFQQDLLEQRRDDPGLRLELARAHGRVGLVLEQLGRLAEAEAEQSERVRWIERLLDEGALGVDPLDLAAACNALANVQLRQSKGGEARASYERAREVCRTILPDSPRYAQSRGQLASIEFNLGVLSKRMGDNQGALEALGAALAVEPEVVREDEFDRAHSLALVHMELGLVHTNLFDFEAALVEFRAAVEQTAKLEAAAQDDPAIALTVGKAQFELGRSLLRLDRPQEAEPELLGARARFERLTEDFPDPIAYRLQLAVTQSECASLAEALERPAEAEAGLRAVLATFEAIAAASPTVPDYHGNVALSHERLAHALQRQGRAAEAVEELAAALAAHDRGLAQRADHPALLSLRARARRGGLSALLDAGRVDEALVQARELAVLPTVDDRLAAASALARCAADLAARGEPHADLEAEALAALDAAAEFDIDWELLADDEQYAALRALPGYEDRAAVQ